MLFILMNYLNTKTLPGNDHNIQSKSIASAGRIIKKFSIDVRKSFFEHKFTLHPEGYTILNIINRKNRLFKD